MSGCPIETFKLNFYFHRPELNQMLEWIYSKVEKHQLIHNHDQSQYYKIRGQINHQKLPQQLYIWTSYFLWISALYIFICILRRRIIFCNFHLKWDFLKILFKKYWKNLNFLESCNLNKVIKAKIWIENVYVARIIFLFSYHTNISVWARRQSSWEGYKIIRYFFKKLTSQVDISKLK